MLYTVCAGLKKWFPHNLIVTYTKQKTIQAERKVERKVSFHDFSGNIKLKKKKKDTKISSISHTTDCH